MEDLIELIVKNKYEFPSDPWDRISFNAKDLIKRCLTTNPKERISPTDALMHPWIANTNTNANILPQTVFENIRKSLLRLSKQKNRFELTLTRAKSGQTDFVSSCLDDDEKSFDDDEEEVKNDEIDEDVGRRAISYAEELNLAFMVKNKQKNFKEALKSVKSEGKMNEKINEEEGKKNSEEI